MKKIIIIFLTLFIVFPMLSQNRQGIIVYEKELSNKFNQDKYKEDKEKRPEYYKKIQLIEQMSQNLLKDIEFILTFNENECFFRIKDVLEIKNNLYYGFAIGPEGSKVYYNNMQEKENIHQIDAFGDLFIVSYPKIEWKLLNETKKIGNYNCYKAIAIKEVNGRKGIIKTPIEAWYTPEIAIPYGPIGYNGLPGLIVELSMRNYKYSIKTIELNPSIEIEIKKPTKGKKVTKEEFEDIGNETMSNYKKGF